MNNRGFSLIALIAIIAVLTIGGGVYISSRNSGGAEMNQEGQNVENTEEVNSEVSASGTFRSLMALGKSYRCEVNTMMDEVSSSGTVYIDGTDKMRADFTSTVDGRSVASSIIRSGDMMYSWSGSQGVKMIIKEDEGSVSGSADVSGSNEAVDLDQKVDYKCVSWNKDDAMFTPPSNVSFFEIGAGMPSIPTLR